MYGKMIPCRNRINLGLNHNLHIPSTKTRVSNHNSNKNCGYGVLNNAAVCNTTLTKLYCRTSMVRTFLKPWKLVIDRDMGSLSH